MTLAAALTGVAAVIGPNDRPSAPGAAGAGGAETSQGIHGNGQTGGTTMRLAGVTGWSEARASSCAAWTPGRGDAVVRLARLDDRCVGLAPMDATTVFVAPSGEGLFGQGWDEMTAPWRRVGDHSLRRLSSGPLVEMSARFADGVVCTECDEVILVLGPDPEQVRGLVESVTVP